MIELIMLSELYFAFITVVPQKLLFRERDYFPDVVCDYRAPDSCNPNNPPLHAASVPKSLVTLPALIPLPVVSWL